MSGRLRGAARRLSHLLVLSACAGGLVLATSPVTHADDPNCPPVRNCVPNGGSDELPYPQDYFILNYYEKVKYDDYFIGDASGVWFTTQLGVTCGIRDRGAFGCAGDIPGAPPGTTNIGWNNGNIVTRYDTLLALTTPPGTAERELAPRTYIEYNGTRCATMADTSVYCNRGPFRFFISPTRTYLSPP